MNFYSSDAFLVPLAQAHFAGRKWDISDFRVEGRLYRLLAVDGRPIVEWPFLDFVEPRPPSSPASGAERPLGYLPKSAMECVDVEGPGLVLAPGRQPAPFVDWARFPAWKDFEAHVVSRRSRLLVDNRRREKKLAAELGPIAFAMHEDTDEAFQQCAVWKSRQYIETGGTDGFFQQNLPLFAGLRKSGLLQMCTLRAGGRLVAVTWSALHEGRLSYWVSAYDAALADYSPGRLLLHRAMEESHRLGHREFDMLIGDEGYKWHYATHARVVQPVGVPPLSLRFRRRLKGQLKAALVRYPRAMEAARQLQRWWAS